MKILRGIVAFFAICIGLYPLAYLVADMSGGLLGTKPDILLDSKVYLTIFYQHISFGGLALLIGWIQFLPKFRSKHLSKHRLIGKVYVVSVLLSGSAGLYIAYYATGGAIAQWGFGSLAVVWVYSTISAYLSIRKGRLECHRNWMMRSFAFTFAAVTLRLWMPLLIGALGMEFIAAYVIIAWLCWVPNWIVIEIVIRRMKMSLG